MAKRRLPAALFVAGVATILILLGATNRGAPSNRENEASFFGQRAVTQAKLVNCDVWVAYTYYQSAKHTPPERANLTASARVPMIGLAGLLNLLDVVEKIQASHASLRDGGESPCPTKLPLVSPPVPERPATTALDPASPTEPPPTAVAVESAPGAATHARRIELRGEQR